MLLKNLILAVSSFLASSGNFRPAPDNTSFKLIGNEIHNEALKISSRILIGVVLVSIIVISLRQIGNLIHIYLSQYVNGSEIEMVFFSVATAVSATLLYFLFRRRNATEVVSGVREQAPSNSISNFSKTFYLGLKEGLAPKLP